MILAILRVAQLPHTFDNSHLSKNSDQKETTTIAYSCRQGQIFFFRPKKKSFLLVAKWHSSPPTVKSNFHLKKHPSTSEDCQVGVGPKLPGYPNWSGLLYVVDFLALPHHLFRWVGYMKTRGNQMMLLAIPWRYDSKLPTTISKRENENPRLFVAGCSVFDLKTLISEANQQSSPTSTLLSWQTSATLNRCLGGCQVLIPFLLVDWSASANAFEDISCFDLLPQQGF